MNYTLHQLEIFARIAETGSVTKASEILNLTQPAVSIQLRNFQAQFDVPLTEVVGRKIFVTDFGREIASAANTILEQVYAINYKTGNYKGQLAGRLKLAVVSTGKYVMPHFLGDFLKLHPHVELIMDVTNKRNVIESLESNEVDLCLVSLLPKKPEIEKLDLLPNKLYLVGNHDYQVSDTENPVEIYGKSTIIFREDGSGTRQTMEQYLLRNNIPVHKKLQLTSNEALKQALLAGIGISIMPLIGLKNELNNGELKIIPTKNLPIRTTWSLIWPKAKKHGPVAEAYLQYLRENKQTIVDERFGWYESFSE
ncbi:MAG: LysR family transcriptional regulator [Flavobacterium sp. BFFFF1]|uniref:LysR family transcriptional regulator n=1 Tax=Flavobacterium sp. BFFFF1 TaxID=2015557 RepID=UPI000BDCD6E8|nr:LysR family transcriptional regulator [Flavobacterium sp. BFFFF1]OYU80635.1 MAG: LysR family transcriptional regulator [Flavobacterium sp. BFFFF1]